MGAMSTVSNWSEVSEEQWDRYAKVAEGKKVVRG
jgi:hypothetical protein